MSSAPLDPSRIPIFLQAANFSNVDAGTLKKLRRYYQQKSKPGTIPVRLQEDDLLGTVTRQFALSDVPKEDETIERFIALIKSQD